MTGLATPPELTTPPSDDSSETFNETEPDDDDIPQLADLTALSEESYSTVTVVADKEGAFGISLRHFTIQSDSNQVRCSHGNIFITLLKL